MSSVTSHPYAVCPAPNPATGQPCGNVHGHIPQSDGTAIAWCAVHKVWWTCGEIVATDVRRHFDDAKLRIWERLKHRPRVQGHACTDEQMKAAAEVDLRTLGRCPGCGHVDGHFVDDGQLWLWCRLCEKRWRWAHPNPPAVYMCKPSDWWFYDVVMKFEDVTLAGWAQLANDMHRPLPARPRWKESPEHPSEYDAASLCPELEHPSSKPIIGVCPECGLASGHLQVGNQTWYYCDEHRVRWHGLNSRKGKYDEWKANAEKLAAYEIVCPKECRHASGKPSLTQLSIALQSGIRRDREKAGLLT